MASCMQACVPKDGGRLLYLSPWLRIPSPCGVWSGAVHAPGQAFLPGCENWTHSGSLWGAVPWLRREEGPLLFVYSSSRQNNCGSLGRIMFVFTGVLKERKKEAQTKPSRERLGLISRHPGRELWNEYQRGNPFPKIAVISIASSESKGKAGQALRPPPCEAPEWLKRHPCESTFSAVQSQRGLRVRAKAGPSWWCKHRLADHIALWPGQEKG